MATRQKHAVPPCPQHGPRVRPRRRALALGAAIVVSVPLAFALAGSSQAAPTLTIQEAQAQLSALQVKEAAATEAFDAGTIAANAAAAKAQAAHQAVATQSAKLATLEKGIVAFAVASYTSAGTDDLDALLAGGNVQTLVQRAAAMNQIARGHSEQLLAIRAQREKLAGAEKVAADQSAAAAASLKQLAAAKAEVQNVIAQEQQVLDHLQAQARAALLAQQAAAQAAAQAQARTAMVAVAAPAGRLGPTSAGPVPPASGAAQVAVQAAYSQLGKPYAYGAAGPNAYDCSGLTMWAYARAGISLPHSSEAQMGAGRHVSRADLQPGDLVFFDGGGHVGIYVGNGNMIDANHSGGWVGVRPLYSGYDGAVRL